MTNHETGHISDSQAEAVYWDNVRDNQIGGVTDGISHEVAEDIGYKPPRSFEEPVLPPEDDNIIGIENITGAPGERNVARNSGRHPSMGRLREMPRRGADNAPKAEFNPNQEHVDEAVIGIAAAREALRNHRNN